MEDKECKAKTSAQSGLCRNHRSPTASLENCTRYFYLILLRKCLWCQRCYQGEYYGFKQVSQRQGQAQRSCQGLQEGQSRHPHIQKHLAGFKYLTTGLCYSETVSSRYSPHQKIPCHLAYQLIGLNKNSVITWHDSPLLRYTLICGKWHTLELPGAHAGTSNL